MFKSMPAIFVLLVACSSTNPNFPPTEIPVELTECEDDVDCAAYELGCCDSCNGGLRVALRADADSSVVDSYRQGCPANTACTLVACDLQAAVCEQGTCALE